MPAGVQITNEQGTFQIDGEYRNYALVNKQSIVTGALASIDVTYTAQSTAFPPILAIHCQQGFIISGPSVSGSTYTWRVHKYSTASTILDCYIYGPPPQEGATFGCQVFNESSVLCFDATFKYFKALGQNAGSHNGSDEQFTTDYPQAQKIAVVQSSIAMYQSCGPTGIPSQPYNRITRVQGFLISGTSLTIKIVKNASSLSQFPCVQDPNATIVKPSYSCTVVDVTGM